MPRPQRSHQTFWGSEKDLQWPKKISGPPHRPARFLWVRPDEEVGGVF